MTALIFLLVVLVVVLGFTYTNGFHDAANAIATVVSTKVLTARQAVILAAVLNFVGALSGTAVAKTIGSGMVDTHYITVYTIFCAMLAGIIWNVVTWYYGIPSSSSHALIGGLLGAAVASAQNNLSVILWSYEKVDPHTGAMVKEGVLHKVILPMVTSPVAGFLIGLLLMGLLFSLMEALGSSKGPLQRFGRTPYTTECRRRPASGTVRPSTRAPPRAARTAARTPYG